MLDGESVDLDELVELPQLLVGLFKLGLLDKCVKPLGESTVQVYRLLGGQRLLGLVGVQLPTQEQRGHLVEGEQRGRHLLEHLRYWQKLVPSPAAPAGC